MFVYELSGCGFESRCGQVLLKDFWAYTLAWISTDLSMKYKREIHMETDVLWAFLAESVACFYEDHKDNVPWQKLTSLLSVIFEKFIVDVWQYLLIYGIGTFTLILNERDIVGNSLGKLSKLFFVTRQSFQKKLLL